MKHLMTALRALSFASLLLAGATAFPAAQGGSTRSVGPIVAAVTVDIYSDFQCPHCKQLAEETLQRVKEDYALKGMIRLVHHDFPLPNHPYARPAALLAAAADKIGKFDVVSDALFKQQESWSVSGKLDDVIASVLTPADAGKVRELAKDPAVAAVVQRDIDLGTRLQITSTPTVIITKDMKSNRVAGFVSYAILKRYLDQLLAN